MTEQQLDTLNGIWGDILTEIIRADRKYADDPMIEPRVGVATIRCELEELQREVERLVPRSADRRKEAVQVATMAVKFIRDICGG